MFCVVFFLTVRAEIMISFDRMSSFFTWSPDELSVPAKPYSPAIPRTNVGDWSDTSTSIAIAIAIYQHQYSNGNISTSI